MSDNISKTGIESALSALEYRNAGSSKYRLIHAIKQFYDSDPPLKAVAPDELVPLVWDNVEDANQRKHKRKNLNSLRSAINSDLMKLYKEGKNPEGIIISTSNMFDMCEEAKDAFLRSFAGALASEVPITPGNISEMTRLFGEFINKVPDDNSLEFVSSILDALSAKKPLPAEKAADVLEMIDNLITKMPDSQLLKENESVNSMLDKLAEKTGWSPPGKALDSLEAEAAGIGHEGIDSLNLDEDVAGGAGDEEELPELDELDEAEDDELVDSEEAEELVDEVLEEVDDTDGFDEDSDSEDQGDGADGEGTEPEQDAEVLEVLDVVLDEKAAGGTDGDTESGDDDELPELDELEELEDSEEEESLDDEALEEVDESDGFDEETDSEDEGEGAEGEDSESETDTEVVEVLDVVLDDEAAGGAGDDTESGDDEELPELDELEEVKDDELEDSEEEESLDDEALEEVDESDGFDEETDSEDEGEGAEGEDSESETDTEVVEVLDVVLDEEAASGTGEDKESGDDEELPELDELEEVEDDELEDSEEEETLDDEALEEVDETDGFDEETDSEDEGEGAEGEDSESETDTEVVEVLDVVLDDEAAGEAGDDTESDDDEELPELDELEEVEDDELEDSEDEESLDDEALEEVDDLDDFEGETESENDGESDDSETDSNIVEVLDVVVDDEADEGEIVEEAGSAVSSADYEGKYDIDEDEFDFEDLPETERKRILAERFDRYLGAMERHFNQFLLIPGGEYTIGNKKPVHGELAEQKAHVNDLFIGKYPVINSLFEVFVERTGYTTTAEKKGFGVVYEGRFRKIKDEKTGRYRYAWNATQSWKQVKGAFWYQPTGPGSTLHQKRNHPVVQVSLLDAVAFASWVGKRLPTEIEWEAAARTESGYRFPWGDDWRASHCNNETSEFGDTTSVDHYPDAVNKLGIADLLGNTLEWTSDKCDEPNNSRNGLDYYYAKGGSWVSERNIHLASRYRFPSEFTSNTLGFRCLAD